MHPLQIDNGGLARRMAIEPQPGIVDRGHDGGQALRPFGMTRPGPVRDHVGMGEDRDAHIARIQSPDAVVADDDVESDV